MKVYLLKDNIERGLSVVERITPKTHTLPILGNILLETEKNHLKLSGTDLDTAVCYWVLGKIEQEGKITVSAKLLSDLIHAFTEQKIVLEVKQNTLFLYGENEKVQVVGQHPEEFPVIPSVTQENSLEINCELLSTSLSSVIDFVSPPQSTRQELTGVYWKIHPEGITFAATDTFRLAEKQMLFSSMVNKKRFQDKEYSFIVPARILRELLSFCQNEKRGTIKMNISSHQIAFEYIGEEPSDPRAQFLSRLLEGDFPSYQEIVPKSYDTNVSFAKERFIGLLKTASVMSPKTNEIILRISPKKKGIEIESKSLDKGEYHSFLGADCKGEELEIHCNWRFLLGGLVPMESTEIFGGFQKNEKPIIFRPQNDASYLYIVMPMRSS